MKRLRIAAAGIVLLVGVVVAQEGIQRGRIKKVDADRGVLILLVGEKEHELHVMPKTRVFGREDEPPVRAIADLKAGTEVMFKSQRKDDKAFLVALKVDRGGGKKEFPKVDTSRLVPLTELGAGEYRGFKGGLYPDGKNERPEAHEKAGLLLAKRVTPLDESGKPSAKGKIVLLSVGMSNTSQMSIGFQKALAGEKGINPHLVFVNGAQGGMTAARIQDPATKDGATYWATVDDRLRSAKASREQVQVVWIKQANAGPSEGFPRYAKKLQGELLKIVQLLPERFPNVKLVYLSSRTYGGYARTPLNPDPYAYESGFSVRWLIEDQLKNEPALNYDPDRGDVKAPWLSWGPYLWANGTTKLADGFFYEESDFAADGTHHSAAGQMKLGRRLLDFFKTDNVAKTWFVAP